MLITDSVRAAMTPGLNKLANVSTAPFQLYVWPQRLLLLTPAYVSHRHRHHAAQITFGLHGPVVFETPQNGVHSADLLLVPPDIPHAHPAFGAAAMLFLEPENIEWDHFADQANGGFVTLPFDHRLRSFARCAAGGDALAAQALVDHLIGKSVSFSADFDPLVSQACEHIRQHLNSTISLADLARAVHRSPSRLAHRFREATGVPLRRFILWCRLRAAAERAMRGSNLTEAAHAAGFADSAHLSRTFRSMFGITPSSLFSGGQLEVTFLETALSI
jgi:AraC-like DNA-binding protein